MWDSVGGWTASIRWPRFYWRVGISGWNGPFPRIASRWHILLIVHQLDIHVMLARELNWVEPYREMDSQCSAGEFGVRAAREKTFIVPKGVITSSGYRAEKFAGLIREQVQALVSRVISYDAPV